MEVFQDYLSKIDNLQHRTRMEEVLRWVTEKYPTLEKRVAWNQPMYTDHGTFIIGFSVAKKHMAIAPEKVVIDHFSEDIIKAGFGHSQQLIRMEWDHPVDYALLGKIIEYNISDKADVATFWRK